MMMMGGMPMGAMQGMTGPDGSAMTPEMMTMMQQMMSGAGMDQNQMGGFSQGYGFDQGNMNAGGAAGGRGNFGGGGRGRRGGRGGW